MNVLVIDDHPLLLAVSRSVVMGLAADVTVTAAATAASARDAMAAGGQFDIVLLDLHLGDDDGFSLLAEWRVAHPSVPIVVVSASDRRDDVVRAIDLGALGFVPKCMANESLLQALRVVITGGIYLPASVMRIPPGEEAPTGGTAALGWRRLPEGGITAAMGIRPKWRWRLWA